MKGKLLHMALPTTKKREKGGWKEEVSIMVSGSLWILEEIYSSFVCGYFGTLLSYPKVASFEWGPKQQ